MKLKREKIEKKNTHRKKCTKEEQNKRGKKRNSSIKKEEKPRDKRTSRIKTLSTTASAPCHSICQYASQFRIFQLSLSTIGTHSPAWRQANAWERVHTEYQSLSLSLDPSPSNVYMSSGSRKQWQKLRTTRIAVESGQHINRRSRRCLEPLTGEITSMDGVVRARAQRLD